MPVKKRGTRSRVPPVRRSKKDEKEIERLVKAGVERFMLKDATIADFLETMRSAAKRKSVSRHPLTRSVFSRIVKDAIKKREQQKIDELYKQKGKEYAKVANRGH